ncbi:aspartate ammonia-lyase [Candidatus Peregrinibacteria bacterium]|jgi:aspartate ammonia-lyase|nr:aspartate ammonia-lyase [Candidatus Peregrinibacteria bacterium]MBT4632000.1 aspartate ammonia-lyase [Candidatus Peregrinibacteria bacterium]MBT5516946.1 aspartate ammonia-lyase [Candidatus Peregrinibacteria bacterium]MBT5823797.1 aspartate ammonia-lyase [Candidatus Peregrinibacteria bacterium]
MNMRIENDALGDVEVPADSYGGSFYTRAKKNFNISGLESPASFRVAFAWIKMAAASVNSELGHLDSKLAEAIISAGTEFVDGKFEYDLDVYQAGAGTPYNMHLNEILANRASESLGGEKGKYDPVHPNNHVNMAQSSNDTNPTATRIAALMDLKALFANGNELINSLAKKSVEYKDVVKVGRTHLQDAVPITLGQEFEAYASSIRGALARLDAAQDELRMLGIGGTATGSGINTHPEFTEKMCAELSRLSGMDLRPADNKFETTHSMAAFLAVSSGLRGLATELLRISNDLRLLSSGPYGGLGEIELPEVEPGSSIMPGKVNPSVAECMSMISIQVIGLDHAIALCAQQGQLELNWHTPLIMLDLLHQIGILTNGMDMFGKLCVDGVSIKEKNIQSNLERSTAMATALAPYMGYHEVAELVNEAIEKDVPFASLVPEEFKKYLVADKMTQPNRN